MRALYEKSLSFSIPLICAAFRAYELVSQVQLAICCFQRTCNLISIGWWQNLDKTDHVSLLFLTAHFVLDVILFYVDTWLQQMDGT